MEKKESNNAAKTSFQTSFDNSVIVTLKQITILKQMMIQSVFFQIRDTSVTI